MNDLMSQHLYTLPLFLCSMIDASTTVDFGRRLVVYYHRNSHSLPTEHPAYEIPTGVIIVDEMQRTMSAKHLRVEQTPLENLDINKGDDLSKILDVSGFNLFERKEEESFDKWKRQPQHERYRGKTEEYYGWASTHGLDTQMCNHHSKGSEPLPREKTVEQQCEELFEERVLNVMRERFPGWTPDKIYQTVNIKGKLL